MLIGVCVKLLFGGIQCCPSDSISSSQCAQRWRNPRIGHFPRALAAPVCQEKAEGAPEFRVSSPLDQLSPAGEGRSGLISSSNGDTRALSCFPTGKAGRAQPSEGLEPHHSTARSSPGSLRYWMGCRMEFHGCARLRWNQALSGGGLSSVVEKFKVFYSVHAFVFMCLSQMFKWIQYLIFSRRGN